MKVMISTDVLDRVTSHLLNVMDSASLIDNIDEVAQQAIMAVIKSPEFLKEINRRIKAIADKINLDEKFEVAITAGDRADAIKTVLRDTLSITQDLIEIEPPADDEPRYPPDEVVYEDGQVEEDNILDDVVDEIHQVFSSMLDEICFRLVRVVEGMTIYTVQELAEIGVNSVNYTHTDFITVLFKVE